MPSPLAPRQKNRNGLTESQRLVYMLVYCGARDRGYQPSLRELCDKMGINSVNAMHNHIRALERKGWLAAPKGKASRCLRILKRPNGEPFRGFCLP